MNRPKIGIGDIGVYVPDPRMDLERLVRTRGADDGDLERRLGRAVEKTGQSSFRFPEPWEDTSSLAGNAAAAVLDRLGDTGCAGIRILAVGTETSVDHSKPVASYVQGMLSRAGYPLGNSMTTFETKHACAGQTSALLSTAAMIGCSTFEGERALVIGSDIARYEAPSTAEITQGAGAAALVVEKEPRLLELDLSNQGYYASDVDDFFRPLGSVTARVKGRYSMECYQEAMSSAIADYASRTDSTVEGVFEDTDYLALHVPFATMPVTAVTGLLKKDCGWDDGRIDRFFEKTGFVDAMGLSSTFGNLYTGSLYAYLANLLARAYETRGDGIVGKRILIASYGSGNTMIVYSATVSSGAPGVISSWDLKLLTENARSADFDEYLAWLDRPSDTADWNRILADASPREGRFYLKGFEESGLRIYERA